MMRWLLSLLLLAGPAVADSLIATQTIRAQSVVEAEDFAVVDADIPGAVKEPSQALGLEAKITIYAGRPIMVNDVGAAALVERNQTVSLIFRSGGLSILTEGRALSRGVAGDVIKVMNLSSRTTVSGTIGLDGTVSVNAAEQG